MVSDKNKVFEKFVSIATRIGVGRFKIITAFENNKQRCRRYREVEKETKIKNSMYFELNCSVFFFFK